jgi:hypothetical protein
MKNRKIRKVGNSVVIALNKKDCRKYLWKVGDDVEVRTNVNKITIERIP